MCYRKKYINGQFLVQVLKLFCLTFKTISGLQHVYKKQYHVHVISTKYYVLQTPCDEEKK